MSAISDVRMLFLLLTVSFLLEAGFCAVSKKGPNLVQKKNGPVGHSSSSRMQAKKVNLHGKVAPKGGQIEDLALKVCAVLVLLVVVSTVIDGILSMLNFLKYSNQVGKTAVTKSKTKVPLKDFATAFSLFKNLSTLLSTEEVASSISCLNGIRVISILAIMTKHTILDLTHPKKKPEDLFSTQFFAVDSFFFLSALLVAYRTLCDMKKQNGHFSFFYYYVHRYLRLTPSLLFAILFAWVLSGHFAYSPSVRNKYSSSCEKYWWTEVLYINNLHPQFSQNCMPWTWYLACDMQMHVLSPIIIIPIYFWPRMGLGIALALLGSGFYATAHTAYGLNQQILRGLDFNSFWEIIYLKPWCRASPYIVGLTLGYCIYKGVRLPFGRLKNSVVYLLFLLVSIGVLGFLVSQPPPNDLIGNTAYSTLSRFAWALALALLVFTCHNGYGWHINSFLSMAIWMPLSKMSFNVYLVHRIVTTKMYNTNPYRGTYNRECIVEIIVLSYGAAALVCLLVELPFGTIESLLVKLLGCKQRCTSKIIQDDEALRTSNQV